MQQKDKTDNRKCLRREKRKGYKKQEIEIREDRRRTKRETKH